ncbi:MAG TPA: type IV pilus secretin PilQ [Candidatus Acidoferrales bacterium]|nr:type IV pilus secretin PilQ [Candidatus Acidoferrales bacterium]
MRIMRRAWGLTAFVAAALMLTNGALSASDAPVVHVKAVVKDGAVTLDAQANGPFEYTTYRPSESLYVLDLSGVSAGDTSGARVVPSELVKSYRLTTYSAGQKPVVRLEILLRPGITPRIARTGNQELTLFVSANGNADASAEPVAIEGQPAPASLKPIAAKPSESSAASADFQNIEQVNLAQVGAQTEVNVVGNAKLTYHVSRLHNPDRIVLDFSGAHLKTSEKQIASNLDPVKEIRLAQFTPQVSRIVIDLRTPARYNVNASGNAVTVAFRAEAATPASGGSNDSAPAANSQLDDVTTTKAISEPPAPENIPSPVSALPSALTQPSAALAVPVAPAPQPTAAAAKPASANTGYTEISDSTPAPAPASSAAAQQAATPPPTGRYSGEPISVNLKDVDLRDFFRLIHEISGLNVVVDPAVKGSLTIVLDDVPWDQALDIVLKNNDLDKQLDGNVLRIATKETLKREAEQNRDLAKAQAESADVVTTTRVLSYAKASDMVPTLKKFLSSRGDILADTRSNTLIIRDIPTVLPVLDNLLRQLDRKSQQVEIEARVVAANRSFSREIGTQFGLGLGAHGSTIGGASSVGTSPVIHTPAPPFAVGTPPLTSGSVPLLTNLGAATPTSGFTYSFANANFALDMVITAAEDRGVGKLISKPKIVAQNNQKSIVKQGTKIPVQTIVNNTVSVQFVDAVLELDVTPQITSEGTIYMDVDVKNDQIDSSIPRVEGIPAIDTQEATSKVLVADGATMVIGGVIVTQQRTDIQTVPVLGSLPVIGNLFKHTTVSSTAQELLFFLTPRILPG